MLKIGINARFLTQPYTGIGQVTRNLILAMARIDQENEYWLVVPEDTGGSSRDSEKSSGQSAAGIQQFKNDLPANFKVEVLPEKPLGLAGLKKFYWEQKQVPQFFREKGVDLAHYLYPGLGIDSCFRRNDKDFRRNDILRDGGRKQPPPQDDKGGEKALTLVTVHDLIPFKLKAYRQKLKTKWYLRNLKNALRQADFWVTVSAAVKTDLVKYLGISAEKIKVIHNAANELFKKKVEAETAAKTLKKYGLDKPFLLYVGGYDKRKNVETLLRVFAEEIAPREAIDLVMVGEKLHSGKLYKSFDLLTKYEEKSTINLLKKQWKGGVKKLGFLENTELNVLYQNCLAFVNLSREEGFNVPLIEAAYAEAPIIVSDIPVHREILGEKVGFCDLNDKQQITQNIQKVIRDQKWREELKRRSAEISQRYSWDQAAKQYLLLYRDLCGLEY